MKELEVKIHIPLANLEQMMTIDNKDHPMTKIVLKTDEGGLDLVKQIKTIGTVARCQDHGLKITKC